MSLALNALFRQYGRTLADADYAEGELKGAKLRQDEGVRESKRRDLKRINEGFADRGGVHSGEHAKGLTDYQKAAARSQADDDMQYRGSQRRIEQSRLGAEDTYNMGRAQHMINTLIGGQ